MRVLLIVPTHHYRNEYPSFLSFSDFPSGYGYIAAALKQAGHEVIGLNLNNDGSYHSAYEMVSVRIIKALEAKPDLIGIGGLCVDYKFIKDALSIIRSANPAVLIVLGGNIVTNDAQYIFNLFKPDFAIVGEAEEAIVRLAKAIELNRKTSLRSVEFPAPGMEYDFKGTVLDMLAATNFENIPGLWFWRKGEAIQSLPGKGRRYFDFPPDYELFGIRDMLDNYSMATRVLYRYSRPYARPFSIVASRGCPFNCTFCIHPDGHHTRKYHARSIDSIMEEIKITYEKYHYNVLLLLDELFAVNKKRMIDFMLGIAAGKKMYGWDFDWTFQTHASAKLDLETLQLAKQEGCFYFSYGIESASPVVLRSMNKKTQVSQIIEAIKLAQEAKIGFGGNLIFGDVAETTETISESIDFFLTYGRTTMIFPGFLMPYPGSKLFDDCVKRGIIADKQHYYETIDQVRYNMTFMSMGEWLPWMSFIEKIGFYWWGVENCEVTKIEADEISDPLTKHWGTPYSRIFAHCPYCGEEVMYRNILPKGRSFLGVGCTKCHKKIKINVPGGEMVS